MFQIQNCLRGPFKRVTFPIALLTILYCAMGIHIRTKGQILTNKVYLKEGQLALGVISLFITIRVAC